MRERCRLIALVLGLALGALPALSQPRDSVRVHVFGNSLVNHLSDSPDTAVPVWLDRLARADGTGFAIDGQWGFLRDFARDGRKSNWSFKGVEGGMKRGRDFAGSGFDTVLITPANFIQYQPPDAGYEYDNTKGETPLGATLKVIDGVAAQQPGMQYLIYEGWPDMGPHTRRFPPGKRAMRRYHAHAKGAYHDWFQAYVAALREARPDMQIGLIPVSSTLSDWLTGPLAALQPGDLYTDDAPHGTPTLYFLAAMISYATLYDRAPPAGYRPPDSIHPVVRAAYPALAAGLAPQAGLAERATGAAPVTPRAGDAVGLANPSLGMGLNGISDWTTQQPFIDIMKTARPWIGHIRGQWGGFETEKLEAGGYLNAEGWPIRIPDGVKRLEAFVLTGMPEAAHSLAGPYLVLFKGKGDLRVTGRADNVRYSYSRGRITFDYTPGEGPVALSIGKTDPDDPVRDIVILRRDHLDLWEAGAIFNPDWLARVRDLRLVRFMDWMFTNHSTQADWADRPRVSDYTWVRRGVPVEVMVALANEIGADPWFTMPHMADDAYMRRFAETVRARLDPRLIAHVEYSNELWNFAFGQSQWVLARAEARWGKGHDDGWMQFAGLRAAEVADIWRGVYAETPGRMRTVIAVHTGWPGLEKPLLNAPLYRAEDAAHKPPHERFDAYAVTGYFGHELGTPELRATVQGWLEESRQAAETAADAEGLSGAPRAARIAATRHVLANARAAGYLSRGSVAELTDKLWPHHAQVAAAHGMALITYEGGTHVTALGDLVNDDALTAFFTEFNYSEEMGALYAQLLDGWQQVGGTVFNAFVDVAAPTQWGSWGALRHLDDANPRWDALMAANATAPAWAEPRAPGTFRHGIIRRGGPDGDRLEGTAEEDVLIGGPGNDVLDGRGGSDRLHGGPGRDLAILPGAAADWQFTRDGQHVVAVSGHTRVTLFAIEDIGFAAVPGLALSLADQL